MVVTSGCVDGRQRTRYVRLVPGVRLGIREPRISAALRSDAATRGVDTQRGGASPAVAETTRDGAKIDAGIQQLSSGVVPQRMNVRVDAQPFRHVLGWCPWEWWESGEA
jgi:hypothetical protein